jgi:hypothetical protein
VGGTGSTVAGLAAHGSNSSNFFGWTVRKVARVGVVSHDG